MESRLAHLRDEKRRTRRELNELRFSENPNKAITQCYLEEIQDLEDEITAINSRLSSLPDPTNM